MAGKAGLKKVTIVNKFGPFDRDITGKSLLELGMLLQAEACVVKYICVRESDKSNAPSVAKQTGFSLNYIPSISLGNKGLGRLVSSFTEAFLLFLKALFTKSDVVIVMTAPALLNYWGIWIKRLTSRKVIFWTMDLYPDAFVSAKLLSPSNSFFKLVETAVYRTPPNAIIALGDKQREYLMEKYKAPLKTFILPCGVQEVNQDVILPNWIGEQDKNKIKFCYAGNLGEAHDESFLVSLAQSLNPELHKLYINLYGTKATSALEKIKNLPVVQQISYLAYPQMHHIDIHIASLLPQWDNVCVPSKAVSAVCSGAVLLLNSSINCDAWNMFKQGCFHVEYTENDYKEHISSILKKIDIKTTAEKKARVATLLQGLKTEHQASLKEICTYIKQ